MAGTGKTVRFLFNGTTQVGADQAQGGKSAISVEQNCRRFRKQRTRTEGIIISGSQVKFRFRFGIGLKVQEMEQSIEGEQAAQVKKSIADYFEKITAGYVRHRYLSTAWHS